MGDFYVPVRVLLIALVLGASGLSFFFWIRALRQIDNSGLDPEERKKWRRRVIMLRGMGLIQWEQYRRKHGLTSRTRKSDPEGLNDAPPPGSD